MRIAVVTLTRDRLDYSRHCFQTLADNAGCDYDHFVVDQGSTDGTAEWLMEECEQPLEVVLLTSNIGVSRGLNLLLDEAVNPAEYDVVVKFDNDCELLTTNTLHDVCAVVDRFDVFASPHIRGLNNPPPVVETVNLDGAMLKRTAVIGGAFMAVPSWVYADGYRYSESNPVWGGDDVGICQWWQTRYGSMVGYLDGYDANHYLTTDGQHQDIPAYFERTLAEGKPAL